MAFIKDLVVMVQPYVGDCPSMIIEQQLNLAARDFFQRSRTWHFESDLNIIEGDTTVYLPVGGEEELVDLNYVRINGNDLKPFWNPDDLCGDDKRGLPENYAVDGEQIKITPHSDAAYVVRIRLALKPSFQAKEIPDAQLYRWGEAIQYLAIANLVTMPMKEWTNGDLAGYYMKKYDEELGRARRAMATGFRGGQNMVQMRPFA
jgi:hypothetical protein